MSINTLLIVALTISILLVAVFITLVIVDRKKHKLLFVKSQTLVGLLIVLIVTSISLNGRPISFKDESSLSNVKAVDTVNNQYKVTLSNGDVKYTKNIIYGAKYCYADSCTLQKKTLFGFIVTDKTNLLVVAPDVKGFDKMSKSEKLDIITKYNERKMNNNGK